jgi:hypothetical protein
MWKRRQLELASGDLDIAMGAEEHTAAVYHDATVKLHECSDAVFNERNRVAARNGRVIDEDVDAVVGVDEVGLGIYLPIDDLWPDEIYGIGQRYTVQGMDTYIVSEPRGSSPYVATVAYTFNGTVSSQSSDSGDESIPYNHIVESSSPSSEDSDSEPDFTHFHANSHTDLYYFRPPTPPQRATPDVHYIGSPGMRATREFVMWTPDADSDVLEETLEYNADTAEAYARAVENTGW